jgi:PelA/Pel-15E family pectate lyase
MKLSRLVLALALAGTAHAQDSRPAIPLKTHADFLAVHLTGKAPSGTTRLEYRLAESGAVADDGGWLALEVSLGSDGAFAAKVPLRTARWSELQVRAVKGDQVLARRKTHGERRTYEMLTAERIGQLAERERKAWVTYLQQSDERFEKEYDMLVAECRKLGLAQPKPAPSNRAEFEIDSDQPESWFASDEARKMADAVISFQTPSGGWSKAIDYSAGPRAPGMQWTHNAENMWHYCGTLDNRTTTEQIQFLASVFSATKREDAKASALRGIEWLLTAQYPNGGWPQNYPVEPGYHEAITINDGAMQHAMEVLLAVSQGEAPFIWVDGTTRQRAGAAFDRAIACLLACQVKVDGKPSVWCAQHDPLSLAPAGARLKEPPSLSGGESADLLKFLMRQGPTTPEMVSAIESGVAWLAAHRLTGLRKTKNEAGKTDYVSDPTSTETYWARFYDIQTSKPMFAGAQDGVMYSTFSEMAARNKVSYDYFTTRPRDLIEKEMERWRKRLAKEK